MRNSAPFVAILLLGVLAGATRFSEALDLKFLDLRFHALRAWSPQTVARDVVVVGVERALLRERRRFQRGGCRRAAYAAWLEQTELRDAARRYWKALAAERPGDEKLKVLAAE